MAGYSVENVTRLPQPGPIHWQQLGLPSTLATTWIKEGNELGALVGGKISYYWASKNGSVFQRVWRSINNVLYRLDSRMQVWGAIHSTKIPTGPTGKIGPPQKVAQLFRNFSGWTEPIHWVWTEISGNFSWMDHARGIKLSKRKSVATSWIIYAVVTVGENRHGLYEKLALAKIKRTY